MSNFQPRYPNSAGRLLSILENIKGGQSFVVQLGPLFFNEIPRDDIAQKTLLGIKAMNQLHLIYVSFVEDLDEADIPQEEKSVLLKGLESLNSLMYASSMDQAMRIPTEAEKALLEVCATRLPKENNLEAEDLELISKSIFDLKALVGELTSNSILKTVLLELIRLSEDSINRFNIYGAKGLKSAFKNMLAEVAGIYLQDQEDVAEIKNTTAWGKVTDHLKTFDKVASSVVKYKPLLEKASGFMLGS